MKKILFLIIALCPMLAFGQTMVSLDFATAGYANGDVPSGNLDPNDSNITFVCNKNSASTNTRIWSNQLRMYQNSTKGGGVTITAQNGVEITEVKIYASSKTGPAAYSVDQVDQGALSIDAGVYTMTGLTASSEVEFWCTGSSSSYRIYVDKIEVTYSAGGPTIGVNSTALTGLNYTLTAGGPSTAQTVSVTGVNLTGNITVNAPTNFEVSADGTTYSSTAVLSQGGGTLYVRLAAGLTEGTYNGKISLASGSTTQSMSVSGGVSDPTVFAPGDLVFIGFDTYLSSPIAGNDEMSLLTMVDIKPGTSFIVGNGAYEAGAAANTRTDKWYSNSSKNYYAGLSEITYTGSTIPAGSVICFKTGNGAGSPFEFKVNGTASTDFSSQHPIAGETEGYINVSTTSTAVDQIFLMQGTLANGTDAIGKYIQLTEGTVLGQVLFRSSFVDFTASPQAVDSPDNMESRRHPDVECIAIEIPGSYEAGVLEYTGLVNTGTKAELLGNIADVAANWTLQTGSTTSAAATASLGNCGTAFTVNASSGNAWAGGFSGDSDNWFNCHNWSEKVVPNKETDVVITSTTEDCQVAVSAAFSDNFGDVAECRNLTIPMDSKLQVQTTGSILKIYGDLTIESGADLDMDQGGTEGGKIEIKGNFKNNEAGDTEDNDGLGLDAGNNSEIEFNGTTKQYYTGVAGNEIEFSTLTINNAAGVEMTTGANSNMEVGDGLYLISGKVTLNDNVFDIKETCLPNILHNDNTTYLQTNDTGTVELSQVGATEVQLPVGNATMNWIYVTNNTGTNANYNIRVADNLNISYNASETETGSNVKTEAVDRVWWIKSTATGGSGTDIKMFWNAGEELVDFNKSTAFVSHYTGGAWDNGGVSTAIADEHSMNGIRRTGITSFSPFAIASNTAVLPVKISNFTATKSDKSVKLNWATATEVNNEKFEIEYSTDGVQFTKIGTVAGNGTSYSVINYDFTHNTPIAGMNYYRLRQVDYDGATEYSNIIAVEFETTNNIYIQPTLVSDNVTLVVEEAFDAQVFVFDTAGRTVMQLQTSDAKTDINVSDLANGMYFIKVIGANQTYTERFIKR